MLNSNFGLAVIARPQAGINAVRFFENDSATVLSAGNRTATFAATATTFGSAWLSTPSGANSQITRSDKTYIEFIVIGDQKGTYLGVLDNAEFTVNIPDTNNPFGVPGFYCVTNMGYSGINIGLITDGTNTSNAAYDHGLGDVMGLAIDWPNRKVWVRKNGTFISGDPVAGTSPTFVLPSSAFTMICGSYTRPGIATGLTLVAAAADFAHPAPAGFVPYSEAA